MTDELDTTTGHYFVQRRRRSSFIEDWRARRREVARAADLRLEYSPARRATTGFLVGGDSRAPTNIIDARVVELAPGAVTSTHRHAHDDAAFVLEGTGVSEIAGAPYAWSTFDTLHFPSLSWHRHRNTGMTPARLLVMTDAPLVAGFGLSRIEDIGDEAPRPDDAVPTVLPGATSYERELRAGAAMWAERRTARRHLRFADVELKRSPKGSLSALLVDRSLGFRTSGMSIAMFRIPPGHAQSKHRHPGEAILYIVEGQGHSVIDGKRHEWGTGDAAIVHQYCWHQHFNGSAEKWATVIRMHMWESVTQVMQAAMDPIPLYEDEPGLEERMAALSGTGRADD